MTHDELWEKHFDPKKDTPVKVVSKPQFLAALAEYGAAVRKRDAEICRDEISGNEPSGKGGRFGALDCADAIEREPFI